MKSAVILIVLLAFVSVQAKKNKGKHEAVAKKNNVFTAFRLPVFAMRLPIFGSPLAEDNMKPTEILFRDGVKHGKLKTKTKTSNSTRGPFKTYTVTTETTSGNKSNPQVYEKVIKSVTTLNKNDTKGKGFKIPALRTTEFRIFKPFGVFQRMKELDDEPVKECSDKKPCAAQQYCDAFFGVCKKQVAKGGACTQKDQCSKKSGNLKCTWGRCVLNSDIGGAGTFCDAHKDCHGKNVNEELGCFIQPDISRFAKLCIPKLGEGSTCGRTRMFDMFENSDDEDSERCQGSLACRAVGFFGRKICMKAQDDPKVNEGSLVSSKAEEDHKVVKKSKHRHRKH